MIRLKYDPIGKDIGPSALLDVDGRMKLLVSTFQCIEHALHPVRCQYVVCEYTTSNKAQVSRHVKKHGGAEVVVALCDHPDTYK